MKHSLWKWNGCIYYCIWIGDMDVEFWLCTWGVSMGVFVSIPWWRVWQKKRLNHLGDRDMTFLPPLMPLSTTSLVKTSLFKLFWWVFITLLPIAGPLGAYISHSQVVLRNCMQKTPELDKKKKRKNIFSGCCCEIVGYIFRDSKTVRWWGSHVSLFGSWPLSWPGLTGWWHCEIHGAYRNTHWYS